MSWRSCSARSRLDFPFLTFVPERRETYFWSNTAGIGLIADRKSAIGSRCLSWRTPALRAAVSASSGIGSHAPNTRSSRLARGTNSLMYGERLSVRLPSLIVAIWVSEPIGFVRPRRILSTPAMKVVATAPRPGVSTPRRPVAGRGAGRLPAEEEACTNAISLGAARRNRSAREGRESAGAEGDDVKAQRHKCRWDNGLERFALQPVNLASHSQASNPRSGHLPRVRSAQRHIGA